MSLKLLLVLLFLAQSITTTSYADDLANDCPPSWCSQSGPEIRLPLSLNNATGYCRLFSSGLNLSCSDNHTLLLHSTSPSVGGGGGSSNVVAAVDYDRELIKLSRPWAACLWQAKYSDLTTFLCLDDYNFIILYTLTKCTAELVSSSSIRNESIVGPISCLSGTGGGYFVYTVDSKNMEIDSLPSYCSVVYRGTARSCKKFTGNWTTFREEMEDFSRTVTWDYDDDNDCNRCSLRGGAAGTTRPRIRP